MLKRVLMSFAAVAAVSCTTASTPSTSNVEVAIDQFAFTKELVTVRVGDTIEWINKDIVDHTSTEKAASAWNVTLATGKSAKVEMKTAGTFDYYCRLHPNMSARVVVNAVNSN